MLERLGGRAAFDEMIDAVLKAGRLALTIQARGLESGIERKADASPVTEADRAVERALHAFVQRRFPEAVFFGEEYGGERADGGLRFVVDPIDGTRAFIRGLPTWSVLVGVEYDGTPIAGIAYLPAADDLFTGVIGHGAYVNGRPLRVSRTPALTDAMVCHGGLAQFTNDGRGEVLTRLARETHTQRGLGDFANYAALLRGQADAVIDPDIAVYDVAPAAVLVREAGGRFTSLTGEETVHGPGALASNGTGLHAELLTLLEDSFYSD